MPVLALLATHSHRYMRTWVSVERRGCSLVGLDVLLALSKWGRVLNSVGPVAFGTSCLLAWLIIAATHRLGGIALARAPNADVGFAGRELPVVV